jgi:hypothetical protein
MSSNLLWKTRTYLVGPMEYLDGQGWREKLTPELENMGIVVFNPYKKPFIKDVQEGPEVRAKLAEAAASGDYDYLCEKFREIRVFDLNLVDRSDFIIAHISPRIASWGSAEELVTANRAKKPIFLSVEGGKSQCPKWIFGMFPHKYIYSSPEEVLDMLKKIDSGEKEIDSSRWRLLRKEFR